MRLRAIDNGDGTFSAAMDQYSPWDGDIEEPIPIEQQAIATNRRALFAKIATALANNQTFLALSPPTTAQAVTQVRALTRQMNALLRVVGEHLDDIADT